LNGAIMAKSLGPEPSFEQIEDIPVKLPKSDRKLKERLRLLYSLGDFQQALWPAPGFEDIELGVFMGPEVSHGETKVYAGVQA
jgi:hypothetical protein